MTTTALPDFSGFHHKTRHQRLTLLVEKGLLSEADKAFLLQSVAHPIVERAEHFIENVIGCMPIPLGMVPNVVINGETRMIPIAVEETSIVAALNKTAKWVRTQGTLTTQRHGHTVIGQIHLPNIGDSDTLRQQLAHHEASLLKAVNTHILASLVKRGGGACALQLRTVARQDDGQMGVIHLLCDTCEAMGANLINQACEFLKPKLATCLDCPVGVCIVSNLTDSQLTTATLTLHDVTPELGRAITEASHFAEQDPYRACTHNKGIMNGIDPILIATGNDWRAVEAGMHAYAARDGQYRALSTWRYHADTAKLIGRLTAPICVGTVGGVTTLHPTVQRCNKLLKIKNTEDLAGVCAAVGLLQNLAALHALTTQGIVKGHMQLHIQNLVVGTEAAPHEVAKLKAQLQTQLDQHQKITQSDAHKALHAIRHANTDE